MSSTNIATGQPTLCELKGWQVAGVYVDNDRSASSGKARPEWDRMLADIKAGHIDAIAHGIRTEAGA
jgi:DNA invertase Pin-like site-specific DNA recombinase